MYRIKDILGADKYEIRHLEKHTDGLIEDLTHSNFKDYFIDCCFYYSSGNDATPIVGCLDITNKFIYLCIILFISTWNCRIVILILNW